MTIKKTKLGKVLIVETFLGERKIHVSPDGIVVQGDGILTTFVPMKKEELESLRDLLTEAIK